MPAAPPAPSGIPSAAQLRARFDAPGPMTVGLEEELMVLEPGTLDLTPRALELIAGLGGDVRFKPELPASQLEIVTPPLGTVPEAIACLAAARRRLAGAAAGLARLAGAGAHPRAAPEGALNPDGRYAAIRAEYGPVARRQLVFALQVHVAVRGADRALAVYNALRSYLPELAALAANAPFHDGRDTGLASVRPTIADTLPRQGVPPAIPSWEAFAEALSWGAAAGGVPESRRWWWELRPHPAYGTLEVRVPDTQTTVAEAASVAAAVHALVAWLAGRHDAGERLPVDPTWRIAENRWSACRHGLEGRLADLRSGATLPTRERLHRLLDAIAPAADAAGCGTELAAATALVAANGAQHQRAVAAERGIGGLVAWLADRFAPNAPGEPGPGAGGASAPAP